MSLLVGAASNAAGGYNLENSLRFRKSASAYLSRTPATAGNRKTFTFSFWVKRGTGSKDGLYQCGTAGALGVITFSAADQFALTLSSGVATTLITTQVFRDPSAWYHIVVSIDTTLATASDRAKIYVNGEQVTSFASTNYPTLNYDTFFNMAVLNTLNRSLAASAYTDAYITEYNFVDGQALTASDFGETNAITGVWQPIEYTGTYGTNGFYINGSTSGTTVLDESSNSNNWASNNMNLTTSTATTYDIMTDVPTLTDADTANYAVLNPLNVSSGLSITQANLLVSKSTNATRALFSTIGASSGKFYWEVTWNSVGANDAATTGIAIPTYSNTGGIGGSGSIGYLQDGRKQVNGTVSAYGDRVVANDIIGVALDLDAGTLVFYNNNVSQGTAATGITGEYMAACSMYNSGDGFYINFGQRPFAYTIPTGYLKLNTFNLPDSSIVDGSTNFGVGLWTGNGSASGPSVTNLNFKPELLWSKSRSTVANNYLYDIVRSPGDSPNKFIGSNTTDGEQTFNAFTLSDTGFTLATSNVYFNEASATYVAWNWKAGGTAALNEAGTLDSQVSANTTAGFSIVTFTGTQTNQTVGHGLGVPPEIIITRPLVTQNWIVGTTSMGWTKYLHLNLTNAEGTSASPWNNTAPTDNVYSVGIAPDTNNNGNTMVAYCFASVEGYSKIGSYTGNGSTDGPFVYTGFRPAYLMVKRTDSAANWIIVDAARNPYNVVGQWLQADTSAAEFNYSAYPFDFTSNGFKLRTSSGTVNGGTLIYMAFAENPFKNSLAR